LCTAVALRALRTRRASIALQALRTSRPLRSGCALRTGLALPALVALRARSALRARIARGAYRVPDKKGLLLLARCAGGDHSHAPVLLDAGGDARRCPIGLERRRERQPDSAQEQDSR
jgi:hypothetical protein